jgi:hypothetical protein
MKECDNIKEHCVQILRQLDSLLERRDGNRIQFIKSEIESIDNYSDDNDKINEICERVLKHLDMPNRRQDDWKFGIIKSKIELIQNNLNKQITN